MVSLAHNGTNKMPANPQVDPSRTILCAVLDEGQIALVRVLGRGNFGNSLPLKKFAGHVSRLSNEQKFIVDLHECETMDSTFMGVLAGICINANQRPGSKVIVLNANDQCQRLLKNLGLTHLLELRAGTTGEVERAEAVLRPVESVEANRVEKICLTLQAHKDLVKVDGKNDIQFQAVIEYLEKSLQAEGGACATNS